MVAAPRAGCGGSGVVEAARAASGNGCGAVDAARAAAVARWRHKKATRAFDGTSTVRYAQRQRQADTRPRVKGRFVSNAEDSQK